MNTSRPIKALIVALPTVLVLSQADALIGAGAVLLTYVWIRLSATPAAGPASAAKPARNPCDDHRRNAVAHRGAEQHRIARTPTGRGPRDQRCPASRATARARRSTRR